MYGKDFFFNRNNSDFFQNWSICKLSRLFLLALNYKAFWEGFVRLRCSVERWFNVVWILASSLGKSFRSTKLLIYSQNVFGVLKFSCFAINALTQCITEKKYKIIFDIIAHFNRNKVTILYGGVPYIPIFCSLFDRYIISKSGIDVTDSNIMCTFPVHTSTSHMI